MPRKRDEDIKLIYENIGILFDSRAKTMEININAHTDAVIRASEDRVKKELREELASKDDIKNMATKDDIVRLEKKFDETRDLRKQVDELKKRLDQVEAELQRVRVRN